MKRFFCMQIKEGQVCLGYDLGHGNISDCVPFSINDGNWHKVGPALFTKTLLLWWRCSTELLLSRFCLFALISWYNSLSLETINSLFQIVIWSSKLTGHIQLHPESLYIQGSLAKAIFEDESHPLHNRFQLLPSGPRFFAPRCKTKSFKKNKKKTALFPVQFSPWIRCELYLVIPPYFVVCVILTVSAPRALLNLILNFHFYFKIMVIVWKVLMIFMFMYFSYFLWCIFFSPSLSVRNSQLHINSTYGYK